MTSWSEDYVRSLITDAGTLRDAQKLLHPGKWVQAQYDDSAAWGLAQGSAKDPYRVVIDLRDAATKCTCPSRKFPCKHAAALMMRLAQNTVERAVSVPDWVTTWIESRQRKREAPPAPEKPVDTAAQQKREAARLAKVAAGIDELRLFLEDLARQGLSDSRVKTYAYWDHIAARMVDAQLAPIARRLREIGGKPFQKRANWASIIADEVGSLYALTDAYLRLDHLPDTLAFDVRAALGFPIKQNEIIESTPAISDRWTVVGQISEPMENLIERRTWFFGESTGQTALLLDFAHPTRRFETHYPIGHQFAGDVVFYPSAYPQRALIKHVADTFRPVEHSGAFQYERVEQILSTYADALAVNPFIERIPAGLSHAWIVGAAILDPVGEKLPTRRQLNTHWVQAITGGDWTPMFGEWNSDTFFISTLLTDEGWIAGINT